MESLFILKSVLIPIVAIVTPLLVVIACLQFAQRRQDRLHQTIVSLIERGLPVPPQLLDPPRRRFMSPLMRALTLVGLGIGLIIFLYTLLGRGEYMPWAVGAIPLAIGIAQLVAIRLERTANEPLSGASTAQS
jgi:hypothetical protein